MYEKSSIFGSKPKSFNLLFEHAEDGKHFTEVENFGYSIKKIFNEIKSDGELLRGFFMYRGEVCCMECDSNEDECECQDRPFDFDEASGIFEYQTSRYSIIKDMIEELDSGEHDCLTFTYETFKPVSDAIGNVEDINRLDTMNQTICNAIVKSVQAFNEHLESYGRNSISNIRL